MTGARIVEQVPVYAGWYRLHRLGLQMPGGAVVERHLLECRLAAAVLPYDPVRRVAMLVSQPRAAVIALGAAPLLEVIAGNLDDLEPEQCARQEALEEAGLQLRGALEPVACIWPMPPIATERVHLYLTQYAAVDRVSEGGGAAGEHEHVEVHEIDLDELRAMVLEGRLTDAKTLILAQALLLARPDLWASAVLGGGAVAGAGAVG
jgi:nudix-type nucleoside diphosphatase (YffH/AdpP family)